MKIELKKIQYSKFASQETACFQADLYVDGKPFAIVSNDGIGGCDMHYKHPKNPQTSNEYHEELDTIFKWYRENVKIESEYSETGYIEGSLDMAVGELLDEHLIEKEVRSLLRRNLIVFTNDGQKGYYKYGIKKYKIDVFPGKLEAMRKKFKEWYGEVTILNDFGIDEACKYYKAHT